MSLYESSCVVELQSFHLLSNRRSWLHDSPGLTSLIFGAFGFPFGFTTIVVCGAELFTSLCAYMMAAFWEGKVTWMTCMR
jgi:formate/nitrite transporter FocA (FNT family)